MWFTWLETSLFDVRFSSDSVVNRIFKAISFGVMTGFAVTGTEFTPAALDISKEYSIFQYVGNAFQAMAVILMVSRLALVIQYGIVFWYVKDYSRCKTPLLATMGTLLVSAMVFLGTAFGFPDGRNIHTYVGWYVMTVVEAIAIISVSCVWRVVSFKHTHLVERVGLLTLIIMGEGIIGLTKSVSTILQNSTSVSSETIGTTAAGVLLIYFIWILYFDQIENERFGTIRQQIWAILHFPLHAAILFTGEGSTQFILWNLINQFWDWEINNIWPPFYYPLENANSTQYVQALSQNITDFNNLFKYDIYSYYDPTANLTAIQNLNFSNTIDQNKAYNISIDISNQLVEVIFNILNVDIPEGTLDHVTTDDERVQALQGIFIVIFYYFLIAGGVFLLVLAFMYWSGKKNKSSWEYASIGVRVAVGLALALITTSLSGPNYGQAGYNLFYSPWMLPLMVLAYLIGESSRSATF